MHAQYRYAQCQRVPPQKHETCPSANLRMAWKDLYPKDSRMGLKFAVPQAGGPKSSRKNTRISLTPTPCSCRNVFNAYRAGKSASMRCPKWLRGCTRPIATEMPELLLPHMPCSCFRVAAFSGSSFIWLPLCGMGQPWLDLCRSVPSQRRCHTCRRAVAAGSKPCSCSNGGQPCWSSHKVRGRSV